MIYMLRFITSASGIPKLIEGDTQINREYGDLISFFFYFSK
jgi:hypothetical protein